MDYKQAGVDVEAGRDFVQRIRTLVEGTHRPEVIGGVGGFSGLCELPSGYRQPVLVSGTDGVGTKLKVAQTLSRHDTVGVDLVAMCVNDVLTCGAEPLFFLDYLATGQLEPEQLTQVVAGVAEGCRQAGCALLGGETAEMPGFYAPGEYDLAGFCVGVVEKDAIATPSRSQIGDTLIGLASSGVHSNGYSLVRRIMAAAPRPDRETLGYDWAETPELLGGAALGETLLTPTRIYVQPVLAARQAGFHLNAMAHITGGGLPENLPRTLGAGQSAQLDPSGWQVPSIFQWLAAAGQVSPADMFHTFNMGIGFTLAVPASEATDLIRWFAARDLAAYAIGTVVAGRSEVLGLPA